MNPNWRGQGGGPNCHGANYNYNPAPRLHEATPLQHLTSYPQFQQWGGYYYYPVQGGGGGCFLPTDGDIVPGYEWVPWDVRMHWQPDNHDSMLVAPGASTSNAIANQNQYQPHPGPAAVSPAPAYNPVNPPAAAVYAQQPVPATNFSARGGNANNDPYASAFLILPHANQVAGVPYRPSHLEIQKDRGNNMLGAVRLYMSGHTVNLQATVSRVISEQYRNGLPLMEVAAYSSGESALKDLFWLAARDLGVEALWSLFKCLADGWIMEQSNGPDLLRHFFTTFHYSDCLILVHELAVRRFWVMLTSTPGSTSLFRCVEFAGDTEQGFSLQATIVAYTVRIASSDTGAFFLETIFQSEGNDYLKGRIRLRVLDNLVKLSMGQHGNYVVQACFVPNHRVPLPLVPLLRRGIQAFLDLTDEQLRKLVQDYWGRCVLRRLIRISVRRDVATEKSTELADRMLGVVEAAGDAALPPGGDRREQALAILR